MSPVAKGALTRSGRCRGAALFWNRVSLSQQEAAWTRRCRPDERPFGACPTPRSSQHCPDACEPHEIRAAGQLPAAGPHTRCGTGAVRHALSTSAVCLRITRAWRAFISTCVAYIRRSNRRVDPPAADPDTGTVRCEAAHLLATRRSAPATDRLPLARMNVRTDRHT